MNQARLTEIAESMLTKFDAIDGDIASMATNIGDILTDLADVEANVDTIVAKLHTVYYIKSTDTKPIDAVSGDELYYVDTGDYFVYYDDEWHLKVEGSYTPITFTLTFDKGDADSVSPESKSVTYDAEYGALATHTYTGYDLGGWFLDTELTDEIISTDIVKIEGDTTVYPEYVPIDYPITYNLDGGVNDPANPATYTVVTPTITLADATKEGFTFDGWFSDADWTTQVTEIPLGSTGAVTLYAKFTEIVE